MNTAKDILSFKINQIVQRNKKISSEEIVSKPEFGEAEGVNSMCNSDLQEFNRDQQMKRIVSFGNP